MAGSASEVVCLSIGDFQLSSQKSNPPLDTLDHAHAHHAWALRANAQKLAAIRPAMMSGPGAQQTLTERHVLRRTEEDSNGITWSALGLAMMLGPMMPGQMGPGQMGPGRIAPR